jgi:hypothetical protein
VNSCWARIRITSRIYSKDVLSLKNKHLKRVTIPLSPVQWLKWLFPQEKYNTCLFIACVIMSQSSYITNVLTVTHLNVRSLRLARCARSCSSLLFICLAPHRPQRQSLSTLNWKNIWERKRIKRKKWKWRSIKMLKIIQTKILSRSILPQLLIQIINKMGVYILKWTKLS